MFQADLELLLPLRGSWGCKHIAHWFPSLSHLPSILESVWVHGRKTTPGSFNQNHFSACATSWTARARPLMGPEDVASVFLVFHGTLVLQQTLSFLESYKISQLQGHQDLIGTSTPIPNSSRTNFPSINIQLFPTTHSNMREQNHDQRVHPGGLGKRDSSQGRGLRTWLGLSEAAPSGI